MSQVQQVTSPEVTNSFKTVILYKDESLGIGSYGAVCKAKCDNLLCAAKIIHPTLIAPKVKVSSQTEHRLPIRRFEQECEFLSTIRHPNIVQYLGIYHDPETDLPVLLMELMDSSLTYLLENSPQPLPYHVQVNICHDVTLALSFLHSNNIIHRDLSSNNVLMINNVRAKVTDFGMARLNPQARQLTFTMCPGTDVYMPPEAVVDKPVYTEKIDCFSLGVITIQVLTQKFPEPGERMMTITDPRYPRPLKMNVPEVERRKKHISTVNQHHPLLLIAVDCLKDKDIERPYAQQLCERLEALKESSEYRDSSKQEKDRNVVQATGGSHQENIQLNQQLQEANQRIKTLSHHLDERAEESKQLQHIIQSQASHLQERDQNIAVKEEENQQLRQDHVQQVQEIQQNGVIIEELRKQVSEMTEKVQDLQAIIQALSNSLKEKDETISQKDATIAAEQQQNQVQRQEHIQKIQHNAEIIEQLKQKVDRSNKVQLITEIKDQTIAQKDEIIATQQHENEELKQHSEERNRQIQELQHNVEQLRKQLRDKDQAIEDDRRQLDYANRQLEISVQTRTLFRKCISEVGLYQRHRDEQQSQATQCSEATGKSGFLSLKLKWREGEKAPQKMFRWSNAVVIDNKVYFKSDNSNSMHAYNTTLNSWSQIQNCPYGGASLAVVNDLLTTIGGDGGKEFTNKLFSLTGANKWTEFYSPMPTKRQWTTAVSTRTGLIVAGGVEKGSTALATVEVMNIETRQWSTAADLPGPMYNASATVCGDHVYMLGGVDSDQKPSKLVYTSSLSSLFQSCVNSKSLRTRANLASALSLSNRAGVWKRATSLPSTATLSTCVSLHGRLLAIGGSDSKNKPTSAVHMYNPITNSWEIISDTLTARSQCFAVVLPRLNQLMVVGGWTNQSVTISVEFASKTLKDSF